MKDLIFSTPIEFLLKILLPLLKPDETVYIVGGLVRDVFLNRNLYDVDLAVKGDVRKIARKLADKLHSPFFMLNETFDTARIVWSRDDKNIIYIDLVGLRGDSIEFDLSSRDFTINAMAVDAKNLDHLLDPCGGMKDIQSKLIRSCSPNTFACDPVRIIRAIRQSVLLGYRIEEKTLLALKKAIHQLKYVSDERIRDELFKLFELRNPAVALNLLMYLGIISEIFPEINDEIHYKVLESPSELVWSHTISVIQSIFLLFDVLVGGYPLEGAGDLQSGKAVLQLGRYRYDLASYFKSTISANRSKKSLLCFAAIFHDVGKKMTENTGNNGSVSYKDHNLYSAGFSEKAAHRLALSNLEINWISTLIKNHMEIHLAVKHMDDVDLKWLYQYVKKNKDAGIGLAFFSLADVLANKYKTGFDDRYQKELKVCRKIFDAYFGDDDRLRNPPKYLDGKEIMKITGLEPGPELGTLIEQLAEETAIGKINSIQDAQLFVKCSIL